jgi:hypothetical protein
VVPFVLLKVATRLVLKEHGMHRLRKPPVIVAVIALAVTLLVAGSVQAGNPNTITAVNKVSVDINKSLNLQLYFSPGTLRVQHGETITFREGPTMPAFLGPPEPHTLTILRPAQVPRTLRQMFLCRICEQIEAQHDPGMDQRPPFVYRVNKGRPGLDVAGDSLLVDADHPVIRARVTAPAGTTLPFICVIHPWMQGRLVVR